MKKLKTMKQLLDLI